MKKEDIEFLKTFVRIFEKVKFVDMNGVDLISYANQIQKYSKIVVDIEKEYLEKEKSNDFNSR